MPQKGFDKNEVSRNLLPNKEAGVAELADALDSKSSEVSPSCRFDPDRRQFPTII